MNAPAPLRLAQRTANIAPFYVMEMAKAAQALAQEAAGSGRPMIFLNIGEPDFTAPAAVQAAAQAAIAQGATQYTPATGLPALRERISHWYAQRWGVAVAPERIVITAGASAALQLVTLALLEPGDEMLLGDPSYPCNRHFVSAAGARPVLLPADAAQRFQPDPDQVRRAWGPHTRGVLLASPSNPTGTSIAPEALADIAATVRQRGGVLMVDEIYLGLSFDARFGQTALALGEDVISINSFSKYFNMTGWRLGWLVLPPALVPVVEKLAQNLYICANTVAQHAALACFEPDTLAEYERRRSVFKDRRDRFIPSLNALGLSVPVLPDGAFYAWADCRAACARLGAPDSWALAHTLMQQAHVAVTPGRDFGVAQTAHYLRFSTANALSELEQALVRLQECLA